MSDRTIRKASKNANKHSERGLTALRASMEQDGWIGAMTTAADGEMIAGSARIETAEQVFPRATEPLIIESDGTRPIVIVRKDIPTADDPKAQRLALADNRVAELDLSWDVEVLAGLDASTLGNLWTPEELSDLGQEWADEQKSQQKDAGAQIDKAAELQEKWNVQPGDLWQLGEHRLICGDCRDPGTWERLLSGGKVNGVFTSPPYAEQRKEQYGGVPTAEYVAWWEAVQANVRAHLVPDGSFFVNIKPHCEDGERVLYVFDLVLAMKRQWGWRFVDELYWRKLNVPPVDVKDVERFPDAIEYIHHWALGKPIRFRPDAVRIEYDDEERANIRGVNAKRRARAAAGDTAPKYSVTGSGYHESITQMSEFGRLPRNVLDAATSSEVTHAAAFPVALPDFFIRAYSDAGDVWVDPFCGSGTTIIAAHQNDRRGMGIELLPKYCAVILERWSDMTGAQPVLVRDGG